MELTEHETEVMRDVGDRMIVHLEDVLEQHLPQKSVINACNIAGFSLGLAGIVMLYLGAATQWTVLALTLGLAAMACSIFIVWSSGRQRLPDTWTLQATGIIYASQSDIEALGRCEDAEGRVSAAEGRRWLRRVKAQRDKPTAPDFLQRRQTQSVVSR